jgi:hypothetical protein
MCKEFNNPKRTPNICNNFFCKPQNWPLPPIENFWCKNKIVAPTVNANYLIFELACIRCVFKVQKHSDFFKNKINKLIKIPLSENSHPCLTAWPLQQTSLPER